MPDQPAENIEIVLDKDLLSTRIPIAEHFENDIRGVGLKEVQTKLDKLSSRIESKIATEQVPDTKNNLSALQKSLKDAHEIAALVWRSKHG